MYIKNMNINKRSNNFSTLIRRLIFVKIIHKSYEQPLLKTKINVKYMVQILFILKKLALGFIILLND